MPKKGASGDHNWSLAFSPRQSKPRPKLFQPDKKTLHNILVDTVRDYKFKKDEFFKRMKVTTFVQLIIQVADFDTLLDTPHIGQGDTDTPFRPDTADLEIQQIQSERGGGGASNGSVATPHGDSSRSRLEEVIRGVGEYDLNEGGGGNKRPVVNSSNCPYLMLDIRDKDAYDECHIITAQSYPTAMLARSVNYESKDMLRFKNQEGKIIIMYDNDESMAPRAATTLVERGYENLFMLSGGLKVAGKVFPDGLLTGTLPLSLMEPPNPKAKNHPVTARESADKSKSDFTMHDLDCLVTYMDSALSDNSSGSRLSQRSKGPSGRRSTMSSLSSSTGMSGAARPPFK
ncbi:centrosomal protein of 41 kDa-like isoform X2 [Littorina saxatilis]|uniref:Rhodanese domain-containing protein n=1 Tax=Littorina saxatilis TaxID=31220 RepID=A0AAN9GD96_9CAEN